VVPAQWTTVKNQSNLQRATCKWLFFIYHINRKQKKLPSNLGMGAMLNVLPLAASYWLCPVLCNGKCQT